MKDAPSGQSLCALRVTGDCSWSWRKILQYRELIRPFIMYRVGLIGSAISFWHDQWLPIGPLCSYCSHGLGCFPTIPSTATLSVVLKQGRWKWPRSNDPQAPAIIQLASTVPIGLHPSEKFIVRSAREHMRGPVGKQPWTKGIWLPGNIPKASILCWLAWLDDRLATKDRMTRWNVQLTLELCEYCGTEKETRTHLFFSCGVTEQIWQTVLRGLVLHRDPVDWTSESSWLQRQRGKSVDSVAARLSWTQYGHTIWLERNLRLSKHKSPSEEEVSRIIIETVKMKMLTLPRLEHRIRDSRVAVLLGLLCI